MSDGGGPLRIKQELETGLHIKAELYSASSSSSATVALPSSVGGHQKACCSPSTSTLATTAKNNNSSLSMGGVNRSNSYSNGATTSSTTSSSSTSTGSAHTSISSSNTTNGNKSSPSVSPDRQLCSSTTTLSSDLHSVSIAGQQREGSGGGGGGGALGAAGSGGGVGSATQANDVGGSGSGSGCMRDELRRLCLVCGDVASGFHYGVASCEACKAFFKRTIQGNIEYTCPANNECEINKRRRKACQACRFQKCLLMGMLKEGVRLDRVRGGRQKYRRNPVSNSYQTMQLLYQSSTTTLEDVKILDVLNSYEPDALTVQQLPSSSSSAAAAAHRPTTSSSSTASSTQQQQALPSQGLVHTLTNGDDSQSGGSSIAATSSSAPVKNENNNGRPVSSSTSSSNNSCSTPSTTPTMCIFQNNNNDPQEILSVLGDLYDKELVGVIGWAKQIPGFTDLPLNDQMNLLRVSWAEILTLQLTFRSLPFNGKLCFATDVWMDELLAKECGYAEFYYHCVQIAQRLERLSPRREEYYLLKALLLSNCDILLDDQSSLRAFRDTILNSLNDVVYLLRHSAAVSHQQQLLLLLPALRQGDGIIRRFWRNICNEGGVSLKKLFVEMLEPFSR